MYSLQNDLRKWYQGMKNNRSIVEEIIWCSFPTYPCVGYQCVFHDSLQPPRSPNRTYSSRLGTLQNLQDIFDHLNYVPNSYTYKPRSILIEGYAGVGKTTLSKEICVQWAEGHLFTPDELVLLLPLYDSSVHKITSDFYLAEYFAKSADIHRELIEYLGKCEGAGVTIVIDGYDLLNSELQASCYLRELIVQRKLPKARIIFTSKSYNTDSFHNIVDRRIEIFGLETSLRNRFIATALKSFPSSYEHLQKHFYQYPNIDRLTHIPRYMAIIVFMCLQHPDSLPTTSTDMLKCFLLSIINHQVKVSEEIDEFGDLPQFAQKALKELERFAFTALRESKEVFIESELPEICRDINDVMCYGLVKSVQSCNSVERIKVLDQDLLVYLAARNVAGKDISEMEECFRVSLPILLELCTSNAPVGLSTKFHKMWGLVFEMSRPFSSMIFPAQPSFSNSGTDASISEFIKELYDVGQSRKFTIATGLQIHARNFTTHKTMKVEAEKLLKQAKQDPYTSCLCLFQYFQGLYEFNGIASRTFRGGIIDFSFKFLLPYQMKLIAMLLATLESTRGLRLSGCHMGEYGVYLLFQYLSTSDFRLNTVDLCGNNLTAASSSLIINLINRLSPCSLVLSFNNISDTGIKDIGAAIIKNKYTKALEISGNGITIEGTQAISEMIRSLEVLDISNNNIGDGGASVLSEALSCTNTLKSLAIKQCNIGEAGTTAIANALTFNSSLTVILMNGNAIGSIGASELSFALCNNSTLKELSLTGDPTIDYAAASELLLAVLYENNTLLDLDLPEEVNSQELLYKEIHDFLDKRSGTKSLNLSFW